MIHVTVPNFLLVYVIKQIWIPFFHRSQMTSKCDKNTKVGIQGATEWSANNPHLETVKNAFILLIVIIIINIIIIFG